MSIAQLIIEAISNINSDPMLAADRLDKVAAMLQAKAKILRESQSGYTTDNGMGDRVLMKVIGPDGNIKQKVDTNQKTNTDLVAWGEKHQPPQAWYDLPDDEPLF